MPDQDDFEPGGRVWRKLERMYFDEAQSAEDISAHLQSRIALMLRICGGIPVLPELLRMLSDYYDKVTKRTLWQWQASGSAEAELEDLLRQLEVNHARSRLSMVAIRSARAIAVDLACNDTCPVPPFKVPERIVIDIARHMFLDRARALAIGKRFTSSLESYIFYEEVMRRFNPHAKRMAASLAHDHSGRTVKRDRIAVRSATRTLMYDGDISM